jgi:hypothetical protein
MICSCDGALHASYLRLHHSCTRHLSVVLCCLQIRAEQHTPRTDKLGTAAPIWDPKSARSESCPSIGNHGGGTPDAQTLLLQPHGSIGGSADAFGLACAAPRISARASSQAPPVPARQSASLDGQPGQVHAAGQVHARAHGTTQAGAGTAHLEHVCGQLTDMVRDLAREVNAVKSAVLYSQFQIASTSSEVERDRRWGKPDAR